MVEADRRARRRKSFHCLFEIAKALTEALSPQEMLQRIAREACELVPANACSIMFLDESGKRLVTAASHGLTAAEEQEIGFGIGEGVAGWVAERGEAARIADVMQDPRFEFSPRQSIPIRSLLCAPLKSSTGCTGVITLSHEARPFDEDDDDLLGLLAEAIVVDLEIARLHHMAYKDPLTEARSRRGMDAALEGAIRTARRDASSLSLMLFDLDHFKAINDELGHAFGDAVLRGVVSRMRGVIRADDQLFRFGGDEFLVVAPGVSLRKARGIARRIRDSIAREPFTAGGASRLIAVSVGVAALRGEDGGDGGSLLARADAALLAAKRERAIRPSA